MVGRKGCWVCGFRAGGGIVAPAVDGGRLMY